jgi:formate dehydrogenase subunit gamma
MATIPYSKQIHRTSRKVLRYTPIERIVHWMGAASVIILILSGLTLLWSPLSFLAAGGWSRRLHLIAAVLFMATPVFYAVRHRHGLRRLLTEPFTYDRTDLAWFRKMPQYLIGRARGMPPQGRINAGQKLHHAATFIAFVTITISGLLLWFGDGRMGATGLAITVMVHDISMLVIAVLLIGHAYFTFVYGALPGMTTGYVSEEYARLEHARWYESLPKEAPWVVVDSPATPPMPVESEPAPPASGRPTDDVAPETGAQHNSGSLNPKRKESV